jgi:hypothetical protein
LSYWGKDLDEEELMKLLKTTPETGTYPEDIMRVAKELGFVVELKENLSNRGSENSTNKGIPVIALGQAWRSRADANVALEEDWHDGHYIVILASIIKTTCILKIHYPHGQRIHAQRELREALA